MLTLYFFSIQWGVFVYIMDQSTDVWLFVPMLMCVIFKNPEVHTAPRLFSLWCCVTAIKEFKARFSSTFQKFMQSVGREFVWTEIDAAKAISSLHPFFFISFPLLHSLLLAALLLSLFSCVSAEFNWTLSCFYSILISHFHLFLDLFLFFPSLLFSWELGADASFSFCCYYFVPTLCLSILYSLFSCPFSPCSVSPCLSLMLWCWVY